MISLLFSISLMCPVVLLMIFLLKKLKQPYLVAYIMAGIIFGPYGSGVFTNTEDIASLGEIGLLLLMFFLGMEIDVLDQRSLLLKPIIAQGIKMLLSVAFAFTLGQCSGGLRIAGLYLHYFSSLTAPLLLANTWRKMASCKWVLARCC